MLDGGDETVLGRARVTAVPAVAGARSGRDPMAVALAGIVATAFGIRAEAVWSDRRCSAEVSFARQVAMYLAHTRLGLTLARTGRVFGRDRTTARHACRRVEDRREDPRLDAMLECLERALDVSLDLSLFPRREQAHG